MLLYVFFLSYILSLFVLVISTWIWIRHVLRNRNQSKSGSQKYLIFVMNLVKIFTTQVLYYNVMQCKIDQNWSVISDIRVSSWEYEIQFHRYAQYLSFEYHVLSKISDRPDRGVDLYTLKLVIWLMQFWRHLAHYSEIIIIHACVLIDIHR